MARILLVGQGGFGDLIPLFALAKALQDRGHDVLLAAPESHRHACTVMGLTLAGLPDLGATSATPQTPVGVWLHRLRRARASLAPPRAEEEFDRLLPLVQRADVVIGNQLAYTAALCCRVTGKRWVYAAASPLAIPSRLDPPFWPLLFRWQRMVARLGGSQRPFLTLTRLATRVLMQKQVSAHRRLGVAPAGHPRFEAMYSAELNLLLTSPFLVSSQADWPRATEVTGFAWFDPPFLGGADQEEAIVSFVQSGPAPVVFAPGGSTRIDPGPFFVESVAAVRRSGIRAIIVAAKKFHSQLPRHPDILVTGYFPYARLFRHAAAVVHSGGIGTLGWAARFGVPSLLVPSEWDQFDNAVRAERAGWGRVLDIRRYREKHIARAISVLLADTHVRQSLDCAAPALSAEDGASAGAAAVDNLLRGELHTETG